MPFACSRRHLWRVPHVLWRRGRWKRQNRKIVPLSPYVEEPLNSKVIKSFVPERRSRKCFSCFEIPMFYLYGHSMYVSHIAISGYGTYVCVCVCVCVCVLKVSWWLEKTQRIHILFFFDLNEIYVKKQKLQGSRRYKLECKYSPIFLLKERKVYVLNTSTCFV